MHTEDRLSSVLSEFAHTLLTETPIQAILDHLVGRIVELLPVDAAGVSLITPSTTPRIIAASDGYALGLERLQAELDQGPCLAAYTSGRAISIPDVTREDRFPAFTSSAQQEGLGAVFTFPLNHGASCLGALDLYRAAAGDLDPAEMAIAQTLADVTTAYLLNAQARADLSAATTRERQVSERLRELDRARTDFVAKVSHELRTPITSIGGYAELLQDGDAGSLTEEQRGFLAAVRSNVDRLTVLADDLCELSLAEARTSAMELVDVDLGSVLRQAEIALRSVIRRRSLTITFAVPTCPLVVRGDARTLEALVLNLMTNAIKFTEDGGWVRCGLERHEGSARLVVSDNGLGIPDEDQARLFTRFFRSRTATDHEIPGSGLGLSIVASIVRRHGGTISVRSGHREGATFVVEIPLTPTDPGSR